MAVQAEKKMKAQRWAETLPVLVTLAAFAVVALLALAVKVGLVESPVDGRPVVRWEEPVEVGTAVDDYEDCVKAANRGGWAAEVCEEILPDEDEPGWDCRTMGNKDCGDSLVRTEPDGTEMWEPPYEVLVEECGQGTTAEEEAICLEDLNAVTEAGRQESAQEDPGE
jgi:hypothetical protein